MHSVEISSESNTTKKTGYAAIQQTNEDETYVLRCLTSDLKKKTLKKKKNAKKQKTKSPNEKRTNATCEYYTFICTAAARMLNNDYDDDGIR